MMFNFLQFLSSSYKQSLIAGINLSLSLTLSSLHPTIKTGVLISELSKILSVQIFIWN